MKVLVSFAALLVLAACATAPPAAAPAPVAPAAPGSDAGARHAALLAQAGRADAPTQRDVERLFGEADVTRRDGAGALLTYRYEQCALMLLFAADGANAMRLAEAHASPRRAGGPAPTTAQCTAEAAARRP